MRTLVTASRSLAPAALAAVLVACGSPATSAASASLEVAGASVVTVPAGYVPFVNRPAGVQLALPPDWVVDPSPGADFALRATNTTGGHNWLLIVARTPDAKPASQSFIDFAATQRQKCAGGTVPDTLTVAVGQTYVCRIDLSGVAALDYRVPRGSDIWHLTLGFEDGTYSGTGQDQAESILKTLVIAP